MARALLAIFLLCGCAESYSVRLRFESAALREVTEQIELLVVDRCPEDFGEAPAESFRRFILRSGEPAEALGDFPDGSYGLYARAVNDECRVIAGGCTPVLLVAGGNEELVVNLGPVEGAGCAAELCSCGGDADASFVSDASLDGFSDAPADAGQPDTQADVFDSGLPDAASCPLGDYPRAILADEPEFYFRFEGPAPAEDLRATTNANLRGDFTLRDSAYPSLGQSIFLSEPDASFVLDDNQPDDAAFTIEAWIRVPEEELTALPRAVLIGETFRESGFRFWVVGELRLAYTTRFGLPGGPSEEVTFEESLVADEWAHVVLTVNPTTVRGYLNGEQVLEAPAPGLIPGGAQAGSGALNGLSSGFFIDELAYYTRNLSGEQIRDHYRAGVACPGAGEP